MTESEQIFQMKVERCCLLMWISTLQTCVLNLESKLTSKDLSAEEYRDALRWLASCIAESANVAANLTKFDPFCKDWSKDGNRKNLEASMRIMEILERA